MPVVETVITQPVKVSTKMSAQEFDLEAFNNTVVEGQMDTEYPLIPEGDFYIGTVKDWRGLVTTREDGSTGSSLLITWTISDPTGQVDLEEVTGRREPQVMQFVNLDLLDNGGLDTRKGKNVQLGQLRTAFGQNSGKPWSPAMLAGQFAKVTIKHRKDKKNDRMQNNIAKVEAA